MIGVKEYRQRGALWVPFYEDEHGALRECHFAAQPGMQQAFLSLPEREGLASGPRGTGKTAILIGGFLIYVGAGYNESWKGIVLRESLNAFDEFLYICRQIIMPIWGDAVSYNKQSRTWTWSSGETLKIAHFGEEGDAGKYLGQAHPCVLWDELTLFKDDSYYKQMIAVNRSDREGIPKYIRSTCNPGNQGHFWVQRRFQPPPEPREGYTLGPHIPDPEGGEFDRRALSSTYDENQRMKRTDPFYEQTIATATAGDSARTLAWRYGSWRIPAGGLFSEPFDAAEPSFTLPPIRADQIPREWRIEAGYDDGGTSPWAYLEMGVADGIHPIRLDDGTLREFRKDDLVFFGELYGAHPDTDEGTRMTIVEIKNAIVDHQNKTGIRYQDHTGTWRNRIRSSIADSSIFSSKIANDSIETYSDEFARQLKYQGHVQRGLNFEPAPKEAGSRRAGWGLIANKLICTVDKEHPGMYIAESCPNLIRTLRDLPRDKKDIEDCPRNAADHLPDTARYMVSKKRTNQFSSYRRSGW